MSLASKLIVYAYYGGCNLPHERYGESYHLYRIVNEYLTDNYVNNASCVRRDIAVARCLINGALSFDCARQLLDVSEVATRLMMWYRIGDSTGLCSEVQHTLSKINCYAPLEKRHGVNIFALDKVTEIPSDVVSNLQTVAQFLHFAHTSGIESVADVFDPEIQANGWWYHKFCVLTYMYRIVKGAVPDNLVTRLSTVVTKFIRPYEGNNAQTIANVYGRFCGIARDHFAHHKKSSVHILFQYMRGDLALSDERHPSFNVIKDFGRHCKDTYTDLRMEFEVLLCDSTDQQKNKLFELLCRVNAQDIDVDCYNYIVKKFYNNKK